MSELSTEERIKLAVSFIEQSPPGEVNDVVNDIRAVIGDDDALMPHAVPALRAYNLAQLQVVEHAASDGVEAHSSLLSDATIVPNSSPERFYDHPNRTFVFDHVTLLPSDYQPIALPEADETFRAVLAESLGKYARNHFPSGHASVSTDQVPLPPVAPPASPVADEATASGLATPAERDQPGMREEEPTPLIGGRTPAAEDEVDAEGGLSKLDEAESDAMDTGASERDIAGRVEVEPTPVVGQRPLDAKDEVDAEGGLAVLDEEVAEVKAEGAAQAEREHEEKEAYALAAEDAEDAIDIDAASPAAGSSPPSASAAQLPASAPAPVHTPLDNPKFTLEIVGNRFNPSNFWTGRWRTRWVVDRAARTVSGTIRVDVHYYEQGNVQLSTEHRAAFELPDGEDAALASAIVSNIARVETEYQLEIGDVYAGLGDKAFRALRRALPVTRQRVDWDKVSGYSIGSDLSKAFA
ncbi:subunits of heterodimeric actin filament capping protein Capz [Cutaneotrichosporon oleaginosum]|uniref:Subunits of heterodimeric actin filament capping protein Capz n=1 Tax=Cutaneotrichosporon oleaginosum TaxID=879819 RepID=A0A0J1BB14_9TREE|nr:subunits of heterodimeric actin filament capping protein Capz [Cutaneotrichosporon oleaginosum]KLT45134.1 subunits of heterodimeric actin filament capping protein Capz [Cutaneotrichosporon oleaginosum]